ncbi:MAG TPA: TIGR02646 family protein [Candidatus Ozemobacteraceae bacterium]|nr:TIGR02646 family protein [Candidatus Ozemobacteraceae bacterium]
MVELEHTHEPAELKRFRNGNPSATWNSEDFNQVRTIIREQLHHEQDGLCVYCECKIDSNVGHIDHIKPRASHPQLAFIFENMAVSCSARDHCGHIKADKTLPIEPTVGCNQFFSLAASTGLLFPAPEQPAGDQEAARQTINILGLNHSPALVRYRLQFLNTLRGLPNPEDRQEFLSTSPFRWSLKGVLP